MIFSIARSMKKHAHKWSNIWICEVLIHMSFHLSLIYFVQNLDQLIQLHTHKVVLYTGKLIRNLYVKRRTCITLILIADWHGLSFLDLKYHTFSNQFILPFMQDSYQCIYMYFKKRLKKKMLFCSDIKCWY